MGFYQRRQGPGGADATSIDCKKRALDSRFPGRATGPETAKAAQLSDFTLLGAPLMLPGLMQLYGKSGLADVLPNAVTFACRNSMSRAALKKSTSFGLEPGHPPSM